MKEVLKVNTRKLSLQAAETPSTPMATFVSLLPPMIVNQCTVPPSRCVCRLEAMVMQFCRDLISSAFGPSSLVLYPLSNSGQGKARVGRRLDGSSIGHAIARPPSLSHLAAVPPSLPKSPIPCNHCLASLSFLNDELPLH